MIPQKRAPASTAPRKSYVSLTEAARRVGVSERTMRRYIAAGTLTGYRLGVRLIKLDEAELDALLTPMPTASTGGEK